MTASSLDGMPAAVRALRGATTIDEDTTDQIEDRVVALLKEMVDRNGIAHDDIISILFTATEDVVATFPATAARTYGLGDVPLICARELSVTGGTPRCIRVMMHLTTELGRSEMHHVYLEGAKSLRDDLPD